MATRGQQIRRKSRLAERVRAEAEKLTNIVSVNITGMRRYHGETKVKAPKRWEVGHPAIVPFAVCDGANGECCVRVVTTKPGAVARILTKRLQMAGISVS